VDYSPRQRGFASYLVRPFVPNREFTAPILVHTSLSCVSIPILASVLRNAAVDSLLVLLQNRNGIDEARRRCIACADPGIGWVPIWMVPERSMSKPRMVGRGAIAARFRSGTRKSRLRSALM
jgi:hypothetical protein